MSDNKKVLVELKPQELEFPEEWTDEQISTYLEEHRVEYTGWRYEEDWRN